jgi:tripartite-type tricarboxylate transporter receptor subunit TctC
MKLDLKSMCTALAVTAALVFSVSTANANEDVAAFYQGKTIQILIGYSAGGGYDAYARTLSRHLSKHMPGSPEVVAKNVPGAGSLVLMNQLANTLPRDGTVFGAVNSGMAYEPMFGNEKAQFDVNEMNWIGNLNVEVALGMARKDSGIEKLEDLKTDRMSMGSTGAGANSNVIPRVLASMFDLNINVIAGYPGANDVRLAMERGEVQGIGTLLLSSTQAKTPEWLEPDSDYNVIYQVADQRHPDLPNVTLASDLAKTERERQVVNLLVARLKMGRPYVAPPGIPEARVAALRKAMADTVKDPEFLADVRNQNLPVTFVSGDEMQAYFREVYKYPEDVVDVVKGAMK